jgi:hypothetical protein
MFLQFSREFTRFNKLDILLSFTLHRAPRNIQNLTNTPLVHGKHPRTYWGLAIRPLAMGGGGTGQIPASRPRSRPGKWRGTSVGSPRACGWPVLGQRSRRRGRMAETGGGGRGGAALGTTRARPEQQVALEGSKGSMGGVWVIAWPWETGRGAARRRQRGWRCGGAMTV